MPPTNSTAKLLYSLGLNEAAAVAFRNRLINGNFAINQRGASETPTVYEPGAFIRDRWRAGPNGCTAACVRTSNGDTIIHIGSGSILQIVEGELYLPEGGCYCLSWQGTAVARLISLGQLPQFESGPVVARDVPQGADAAVEFSLPHGFPPVSVTLAQLEPGTNPTVFERRDEELARCRRYFRRLIEPPLRGVVHAPELATRCGMALSPPMRIVPIVTMSGALYIYDGTTIAVAASIAANYSTSECVELDINLASQLNPGRPAIMFTAGQKGYVDVSAEI